jgi:hypothetical protein
MPLPSSGQLSINQIRNELGTSNGSLRTLSAQAGFSTPDRISEFYGYSATTNVFISYYVPSSLGCFNNSTFAAQASAVVNTTLDIGINWFGDLGGFVQAFFTINAGTFCNSTTIYTGGNINCVGENIVAIQHFFSPDSFGNQVYGDPTTFPTGGGVFYDFYPC